MTTAEPSAAVATATPPYDNDKIRPEFENSILDNGQRLLVIIGKEHRMIKLL